MTAIQPLTPVSEIPMDQFPWKIPTSRYTCPDIAGRERDTIWMKCWQIAGRENELPAAGDWKRHDVLDQSFVIVRGKDGKLRGFVNACRHRGNILCDAAKGHTPKFTCPYHLWTYDLDGALFAVARPDLVGPIDKGEHGLVEVPVDTAFGFIFINPDPQAGPLSEFLGDQVTARLDAYKLGEMTPVGMDVREELDCNWKVVVDAFSEGYHIIGVHPELLKVIDLQAGNARHGMFGDHGCAVSPFEVKDAANASLEEQVQAIRDLPSTFPTVAEVLPLFESMVAARRDAAGALVLGEGQTVRTILQQATRQTLTAKGLDVSSLADDQMSDNQGWFLFPNMFMTIRAGEATTILAWPHPSGDPGKCIWHVTAYMWLPEALRTQYRAQPVTVTERGTYPYFLALQQDYDQMPRQQAGLRNAGLTHLSLVREELSVARFHRAWDRWMG
ncbi:aromatic ring-hydroxylating dioxygenase subunit alpha [Novosphingobium sp. MW5]|nr:aromatic ring-hydroxylating dioxygenase subunit alpha [Novosphingobium sp. MW5]